MRLITPTHTGSIITDTDLNLEYLYVGDYGKENNIKADFLGYTRRINKVDHHDVKLTDKLVVTVSSQKGCPMNCDFCDCPKVKFKGNASAAELVYQITSAVSLSGIDHGERLNIHFARMGEPTFNPEVITAANTAYHLFHNNFGSYHPVVSTMMPNTNLNLENFLDSWVRAGYTYGGEDGYGLQFSINTLNDNDRNRMFNNRSLSLEEISKIIDKLPAPKKRKFTLNFAATSKSNLCPILMDKYFDKEKCIVKITPIHETREAVANGYEIMCGNDFYDRFEQPLVEAGWDVIVFIPSAEEDADRITCGNALISALHNEGNG